MEDQRAAGDCDVEPKKCSTEHCGPWWGLWTFFLVSSETTAEFWEEGWCDLTYITRDPRLSQIIYIGKIPLKHYWKLNAFFLCPFPFLLSLYGVTAKIKSAHKSCLCRWGDCLVSDSNRKQGGIPRGSKAFPHWWELLGMIGKQTFAIPSKLCWQLSKGGGSKQKSRSDIDIHFGGGNITSLRNLKAAVRNSGCLAPVSYTHLTLPTRGSKCRSRWSPYH